MTDEELDKAFVYGDLPRSSELWEMFRDYVERWDARRESEYKQLLKRIQSENPNVFVQAPLPPMRSTPKTLEWLEMVKETERSEFFDVQISHDKIVANLQQGIQYEQSRNKVLELDQTLLHALVATYVADMNHLLHKMLKAEGNSRFWFGGCIVCALLTPLLFAIAWLEEWKASFIDQLLLYGVFFGVCLAIAKGLNYWARLYFRRLQKLVGSFSRAGFVVYRNKSSLGRVIWPQPSHAASNFTAIDPDKMSFYSLYYESRGEFHEPLIRSKP